MRDTLWDTVLIIRVYCCSKSDNQSLRGGVVGEASTDPQTVVQNNTDSGLIGDGFRWRKYGQKVVKGKKYPRLVLDMLLLHYISGHISFSIPNNASHFFYPKKDNKLIICWFCRSYYRCTNPDCNVRKYVERTFEDPGTFITTYEGKHNHAMPIKPSNADASKTSTKNWNR